MATLTSYSQQCKNKEPDFVVGPLKRFRWSHFRFEYGYKNYITYPVEGPFDKMWWTWEKESHQDIQIKL